MVDLELSSLGDLFHGVSEAHTKLARLDISKITERSRKRDILCSFVADVSSRLACLFQNHNNFNDEDLKHIISHEFRRHKGQDTVYTQAITNFILPWGIFMQLWPDSIDEDNYRRIYLLGMSVRNWMVRHAFPKVHLAPHLYGNIIDIGGGLGTWSVALRSTGDSGFVYCLENMRHMTLISECATWWLKEIDYGSLKPFWKFGDAFHIDEIYPNMFDVAFVSEFMHLFKEKELRSFLLHLVTRGVKVLVVNEIQHPNDGKNQIKEDDGKYWYCKLFQSRISVLANGNHWDKFNRESIISDYFPTKQVDILWGPYFALEVYKRL